MSLDTSTETPSGNSRNIPRLSVFFMGNSMLLSIAAVVVLIISCYLAWGRGPYARELPLVLIVITYIISVLAVINSGFKKPAWLLFLLLGIIALVVEFFYLLGLHLTRHFSIREIIDMLYTPRIGIILHFTGAILLFVNTYFARLRYRLAFHQYVRASTRWQY